MLAAVYTQTRVAELPEWPVAQSRLWQAKDTVPSRINVAKGVANHLVEICNLIVDILKSTRRDATWWHIHGQILLMMQKSIIARQQVIKGSLKQYWSKLTGPAQVQRDTDYKATRAYQSHLNGIKSCLDALDYVQTANLRLKRTLLSFSVLNEHFLTKVDIGTTHVLLAPPDELAYLFIVNRILPSRLNKHWSVHLRELERGLPRREARHQTAQNHIPPDRAHNGEPQIIYVCLGELSDNVLKLHRPLYTVSTNQAHYGAKGRPNSWPEMGAFERNNRKLRLGDELCNNAENFLKHMKVREDAFMDEYRKEQSWPPGMRESQRERARVHARERMRDDHANKVMLMNHHCGHAIEIQDRQLEPCSVGRSPCGKCCAMINPRSAIHERPTPFYPGTLAYQRDITRFAIPRETEETAYSCAEMMAAKACRQISRVTS